MRNRVRVKRNRHTKKAIHNLARAKIYDTPTQLIEEIRDVFRKYNLKLPVYLHDLTTDEVFPIACLAEADGCLLIQFETER